MERSGRNSAVELLRIIYAVGIIVLHYNNKFLGGGFQYVEAGSFNEKWLYFSESVFIVAVNVFILISGYYSVNMSKGNTRKIFELLAQTGIFTEIFYFIDILCSEGHVTIRGVLLHLLPNNYFVILFCVLSLLAPYINMYLKQMNMSRNRLQSFMVLLFVLFSIEPFLVDYFDKITETSLAMLSSVSALGSQSGYSIINFCMLYMIGASFRLLNIKIRKSACIMGSMIGVVIIWLFSMRESLAWNYNNPINIVVAALLVNLAVQTEANNQIINKLAGASFTSLLFHAWFLKYIGIEQAVKGSLLRLVFHQLISCTALFLASYFVYLCWRLVWNKGMGIFHLDVLFSKLDSYLWGGYRADK